VWLNLDPIPFGLSPNNDQLPAPVREPLPVNGRAWSRRCHEDDLFELIRIVASGAMDAESILVTTRRSSCLSSHSGRTLEPTGTAILQ